MPTVDVLFGVVRQIRTGVVKRGWCRATVSFFNRPRFWAFVLHKRGRRMGMLIWVGERVVRVLSSAIWRYASIAP